jgi:hypothetical protein
MSKHFSTIYQVMFLLPIMVLTVSAGPSVAQARIKVMILTGQCNQYHNWALSSAAVRSMLDQTGKFDVTVVTSPAKGQDMSAFKPTFAGYGAVVMDYEGDDWPEPTRQAFVEYVRGGGGLVLLHAADNSFPKWPEFLEMSGVGGWEGRDESWGPKVRWRDGKIILDTTTPGNAMHPAKHDFLVVSRAPEHPIMKGLPAEWLHASDELYSQLRGPAKNLEGIGGQGPGRDGRERADVHDDPVRQGPRVSQHTRPCRAEGRCPAAVTEQRWLHRLDSARRRVGGNGEGDAEAAGGFSDRYADVASEVAVIRGSRVRSATVWSECPGSAGARQLTVCSGTADRP